METTVSSNPNSPNSIFCSIRKEWVKKTPEEGVRQQTILWLLSLGYSPSLIVVERKISQLPHLVPKKQKFPNRRIDIMCYEAGSLCPLLLVECKVKSFSIKELRQILGYNFHIGAKMVLLTNATHSQLFDAQGTPLPELPSGRESIV